MYGGVVEDLVERAGEAGAGELGGEGLGLGGGGIVNPLELGTGLDEAVALAVDVAVVEVGGGEDEFAGRDDGGRFALGGVVHAIGSGAHGCKGGRR